MTRALVVAAVLLVILGFNVSWSRQTKGEKLDVPVRHLSSSGTDSPSANPSVTPSKAPTLQQRPTHIPTKAPTTALPTPTPKTPPHIVMIVVDDMGFGDLGVKGSGINTPTVDNLLTTGTHFTNYCTLEACTQSRIAIMTGKYPYRSGIYRCIGGPGLWGMDVGDNTIANALRDRGYQAHAIGKWHVGHASFDFLPTFRGFQSYYGIWKNQFYMNHSDGLGTYDLRWDKEEFYGTNLRNSRGQGRIQYNSVRKPRH